MLTALKLLTIHISRRSVPGTKKRERKISLACLAGLSDVLFFPPPSIYYGWISALACEFGAKCNRRTILDKKKNERGEREKKQTTEQREFFYHNMRGEEFSLCSFYCLQMFPQSDSAWSDFFVIFSSALLSLC